MKYIKNYNQIFYLTSSGGCMKDLINYVNEIKTILHINISGRESGIDTDWDDFDIEVKYFDLKSNYDLNILKDADCIIFHGGDINYMMDNVKFRKELKNVIENCKFYVGYSAGSVFMSKNSFLPKDGDEVMTNILNEDILDIGMFDFGIDVHFNSQLTNEIYMENLDFCVKNYTDRFYLLTEGSYLKVENNNVKIVGEVYTNEDF